MSILYNKTFGMISLGCDKNRVDAERLLGEIRARGYAVTDDIAEANILLVNTCAFLNDARKEAIDTILECDEYRRAGKLEKLVVTGCLPEKFAGELFPSLTEGDVFLGCGDADALFDALERSYREGRVNAVGSGHEWKGQRVLTTPLHYGYLKIADGCDNHCTYCLIPKIRGRYRSERMEDLVAEAASLGELSELILVAQDTTRYGEDLYGKSALPALLKALSQIEKLQWIRVLYCYPERISDELIDVMASSDKILNYLDIPIQHADAAVLKAMNRKGDKESLLALLGKIREKMPDVVLRTTLITGFPGETEEAFETLCEFVKEARFDRLGCFAYSTEEGTPAALLPDQIDEDVRKERGEVVMEQQYRIFEEKSQELVGKILPTVVEGYDAYTDSYYGRTWRDAPEIDGQVHFTCGYELQDGDFVEVEIFEVQDYDLIGEVV